MATNLKAYNNYVEMRFSQSIPLWFAEWERLTPPQKLLFEARYPELTEVITKVSVTKKRKSRAGASKVERVVDPNMPKKPQNSWQRYCALPESIKAYNDQKNIPADKGGIKNSMKFHTKRYQDNYASYEYLREQAKADVAQWTKDVAAYKAEKGDTEPVTVSAPTRRRVTVKREVMELEEPKAAPPAPLRRKPNPVPMPKEKPRLVMEEPEEIEGDEEEGNDDF